MRVLFLILVVLVALPTSSWAKCSKAKVCTMMKKMGHFDILNQCPAAGPLLAECKKVSDKFKKGGLKDPCNFGDRQTNFLSRCFGLKPTLT